MKDFLSICKLAQLHKKSAALLTPEAEAAAMPPQDPSAMGGMPPQGGMPMDPSMMGGQPPMDPSMMGGVPPQGGAPMDSSMMQGGMPQDPSMMGGQPPVDPNTGMPMDPSMMGGDSNAMGTMDPSMMQDPNAMGGMPTEGMDPSMMDPSAMGQGMPLDMMNNMASIIMDSVDSVLDERMAALDKKISAFADKLDSIKSMLDDLALGTDTASKKQLLDNDKLNAELEADLRGSQQPIPQQLAGTLDLMKSASVTKAQVKVARSILDIMRG